MADVHDVVDEQEEGVAVTVAEVLDEVADEFAAGLAGASEIVAARFSVSRIAGMFTSRMPRIVRRLLGVSEAAAAQAADDIDGELPDGWDDLPGRYDDGTLPPAMSEYVDVTEHLLRAVGERLAEAARDELAAGVDAGDDMEALRARLRERFAREGSQLGEGREERVARTESGRAWNTATLGAAQAMEGPDRPLVKQWLTRRDDRVRHDHADANGQLQLLDDPFTVGGIEMSAPHDPTAPANQVVNCFPGDTLVQVPSGVRRIYRRWYEGPLVEVHTVGGGKLAGTPNHPLLTDAGWQAMQRVQVGDKLVGAPVGVRVGAGDPDVEQGPASLSELYRAARDACAPSGVVRGVVDFHGDAAHGDVEVVTVDRNLWAWDDAASAQPGDDLVLNGADVGPGDLALSGGLRGPRQVFSRPGQCVLAPSAGAVGGLGEGGALLERQALHAQPVGLAPVPDAHLGIGEAATDHQAGDPEGARQGELGLASLVAPDDLGVIQLDAAATGGAYGLPGSADHHTGADQGAADHAAVPLVDPGKVHEGLAGLVTLHEVSDVQVRQFSGHVYNLETQQGWYIANDIASHNCRCLLAVAPDPDHTRPDPVASVLRQVPGIDEETAARIVAWDNPSYQPPVPVESQAPSAPELSDQRPTWMEEMDAVIQRQLAAGGVPDADKYRLAYDDSPLPVLADDVTAAAVQHTGAMIALVPTEEDAERLALDDGEPADELHLTLWYLGEGADWGEDQRRELIAGMRTAAARVPGPLTTNAFGVNHWNPQSDSPSWVWAVGDDRDAPDEASSLHELHNLATDALEDGHNNPELPAPHSPWVPHVCGVYDADSWPLEPMTERVGPITFDRIRVAFAGERTDIPLGTGNEEQETMPDNTAAAAATEAVEVEAPPTRSWSTPDDTALAFEDQETGDGRLFTTGALSWDGPGPWPLQYADEMLMGHQGAELAGAINTVARDGQRITGSGVLYLSRPAGLDAVTLLEQEAPLGVSVDLDDVDVEFVDRTLSEEEDGWMFASARLPAASVLRMADGSLMLLAATAPAWSASGHSLARSGHDMRIITDAAGMVTADTIRTAFAGRGVLTAAAGDADDPEAGIVIHSENAGDFLMRITRARLRGATLVAMPAYSGARIVLDPVDETAAAVPAPIVAAAGSTLDRIVTYVRTSPAAVGPRQVAKVLGISMTTARTYLNNAVELGRLLRLAPGLYTGPCTSPEGPPELAADGGDPTGVTAALDKLAASAWHAMQDADPLPAEWFREPTADELPPGSGGVHYKNGRVYGWVAQAGEPHAGFPNRKLTIESLGKIDLSHFLRAKFTTDEGGTVRVGTFTMNVPHNRDGAECENDVCQFDDSRTVAGIVTVGMSKGGMWFSGAAAPWLSEWDRHVFKACQPSYHMRQGKQGWQLRAVLSVPVPGHSSPLVATAVTERANLALAASAAGLLAPHTDTPDTVPGQRPDSLDTVSGHPVLAAADLPGQRPDNLSGQTATVDVDALAAALLSGPFVDQFTAAVREREDARRAEIEQLAASIALTPEEITASGAVAEMKGAS